MTQTIVTVVSLPRTVAEVCADHPDVADPSVLTDFVLAEINPDDYRDALKQSLHNYVSSYISGSRPTRASGMTPPPGNPNRRTPGRSRLAGISDVLASREYSPFRGQWILLRDATLEDLRSIVTKREELATAYQLKAAWYRDILNAIERYKVDTVNDLPADVKTALLYQSATVLPPIPSAAPAL